jgi:multidrug efflux pump subunit AcrA (membrane-fusion protein)
MVDKQTMKLAVPLAKVADWMARSRMTERQLDKAVLNARAKGATWQDIANAAELTRQGANQRWGAKERSADLEATRVAKGQGRLAL